MSPPLNKAQRAVVKIGSALLVDSDAGTPRQAWLAALATDIAAMRARGQEVVVVSSGAIALGRRSLGLPKGSLKLRKVRPPPPPAKSASLTPTKPHLAPTVSPWHRCC